MPLPRNTTQHLTFDAAVISLAAHETAHFAGRDRTADQHAPNQDYGRYEPGIGVFVADGSGEKGNAASELVICALIERIQRLDVRTMEAGAAVDTIQGDILPYTGRIFDTHKAHSELPSDTTTALGGLIMARNHLIAIAIDTPPIFGRRHVKVGTEYQERFYTTADDEFAQHTSADTLSGNRQSLGVRSTIAALKMRRGDRYVVATDGLLGREQHQQIPREILSDKLGAATSAAQAARSLARLPHSLQRQGQKVGMGDGATEARYEPREDHLTVAPFFIH